MMIKRVFDLTIILLFLPLFLPLIVLISIFSLLQQGKPIFFIQNRVGKNNRLLNFINLELWK